MSGFILFALVCTLGVLQAPRRTLIILKGQTPGNWITSSNIEFDQKNGWPQTPNELLFVVF